MFDSTTQQPRLMSKNQGWQWIGDNRVILTIDAERGSIIIQTVVSIAY